MENGIYHNISSKEYHAMSDIVSNSYLGRLSKCPANALVPQEETEAMKFGRAFHTLVLEGIDVFNQSYFIAENRGKQSKDDKAYWVEIGTKYPDKEIIKQKDFDIIEAMKISVLSHPSASKFLKEGISETTIIWTDQETGIQCKVRPDRIPDGNKGVILDLKSTSSASKNSFQTDCIKYGYAREMGMYLEGFSIMTGSVYMDLIAALIAVEKEPPYRCEVYTIETDFLEYGYAEFHRLLQIEKICREQKFYPHYNNAGVESIFKPAYAKVWEFEGVDQMQKDFSRGDR